MFLGEPPITASFKMTPPTLLAPTTDEVFLALAATGTTTATGIDYTYWNGWVKLEYDNDQYAVVPVHFEYLDSSDVTTVTDWTDVINAGTVQTWFRDRFGLGDKRVKITNYLGTYDFTNVNGRRYVTTGGDLLKNDAAKKGNLMLNDVYDMWSLIFVTETIYTEAIANRTNNAVNWINDSAVVDAGNIDTINSRVFKEGKEKMVKAENAKFIHNGAFRKNKQMKKLILNDGKKIKKVNEKAFYDCKNLKTVKIGSKTLKQIGKNAFGGSTDKKSLRIKIKGNKNQYNKAVKKFKKSGVKKAKFAKI